MNTLTLFALREQAEARSADMPMQLDETYEPRPWCCDECNRVLGVVMRDANRIRRLYVFTLDRGTNDVPPKQILFGRKKGLFRVHGADSISRPGGVECSVCGALNDWVPSKESFEKLMVNYSRKTI